MTLKCILTSKSGTDIGTLELNWDYKSFKYWNRIESQLECINFELKFDNTSSSNPAPHQIWMCGGRLLSLPCSRVGHIFRDRAPYNFGGQSVTMTLYRNYARAVEVIITWFYWFVIIRETISMNYSYLIRYIFTILIVR